MRKLTHSLLLGTALCASLASATYAADLPSRKAPAAAPAAPLFTWTGYYIGANIGGVWTSGKVSDLNAAFYGQIPGNSNTRSPSGVVGGIQAGYNWQLDNVVVGLEGEFELSSAKSNLAYTRPAGGTATHSTSLPVFGDLRMRVGYAFDRWLPYLTGGIVFANIKDSFVDNIAPARVNRGSQSTGYTLGGGVEYAIDSHWSVKAEYQFIQFSNLTRTTTSANPNNPYAFRFSDSAQVAKIGANYRF